MNRQQILTAITQDIQNELVLYKSLLEIDIVTNDFKSFKQKLEKLILFAKLLGIDIGKYDISTEREEL